MRGSMLLLWIIKFCEKWTKFKMHIFACFTQFLDIIILIRGQFYRFSRIIRKKSQNFLLNMAFCWFIVFFSRKIFFTIFLKKNFIFFHFFFSTENFFCGLLFIKNFFCILFFGRKFFLELFFAENLFLELFFTKKF